MNSLTRRSLTIAVGFATTALVATVGLTGCSDDDNIRALPAETATAPATGTAATGAVDPLLAGLVGPGCADYAARVPGGAGSVGGMALTPLVTAIRNNPLLKSLSAAVAGKLNKDVKLVDTFNGGEYTVFAPVDAAFTQIPAASLAEFRSDRQLLVKVLTHHLVDGQLLPEEIVGTQKSVEGSKIKITGSGAALKVGDANVICGGFTTVNATVYLIDRVLTPPK